MDPFPQGRINSGLLKLTCPLLVKAVDSLEDDGMIDELNKRLSGSQALQDSMTSAHLVHAKARKEILNTEDMTVIQSKLGERGAISFLEAGVAAASSSSMDAKCLHAWLADYLFRPGDTLLGDAVARELEDRGVDLTGTLTCGAFCDPSSSSNPDPPVPRNKQRLRTGRENQRKKRRKLEARDDAC
jgi:hypothetical protein